MKPIRVSLSVGAGRLGLWVTRDAGLFAITRMMDFMLALIVYASYYKCQFSKPPTWLEGDRND